MGPRMGRMAGRSAQKVFGRHAVRIGRAADIGAKSAGLGWIYVLAVFAVILVGVWVAAFLLGGWVWVLAAAVTVSVVPPTVKELRKRNEIREAMDLRR